MKDPNLKTASFTPLNKDIAGERPAQQEEKYRSIVENSIHAFFLTISDGTILESNQAASDMFGYSTAEFRQLRRWDFIDHNDPKLLQALDQREKTGFAMTEATGIRKNGQRFPVEISSTLFTDTDGLRKSSTMVSDISVRKQTEEAMKLSNERFNLVVKATNDLVWDWDLTTGEIYRSGSGLAEVYGHSSNEAISDIHRWAGYLHPYDKERIGQQITHFIESDQENTFNFEYRFLREDGTYVYISDKGYIIRNEEGKATRMIGAARDITEQKKAALALEESEERYKMFIGQSTEGIWRIELKEPIPIWAPVEEMVDTCFRSAFIAECNDAYAQMYGFNRASELTGIPLHKLWPRENATSVEYISNFFRNGFKANKEISYEFNRDGEGVIFVNTMTGITKGDHLRSVWGIRSNITEQKKSEQALARSENQLRAIIQTDPECIKLLDREGLVLEMNPAGLSMIEASSADQVIGNNALDLVLPPYREAFKQMINDVFEGKQVKLEFEIKGLKGRRLFMQTHCVPLRNADEEIIAVLSVTRDVTENKNAEALLLASEERYRYLFNHNPASIIIWDAQTREIIEVNETAVKLYGYSKEKFLQLNATDLLHKEKKVKRLKPVHPGDQDEWGNKAQAQYHATSTGNVIIMEIASHGIQYKGRNAVLALGNNITEKIQLENSLNEERQMRQQQITEAVITGQEKERTELGQELHDNINQVLASTKLFLECAIKSEQPRMDLVEESRALIEKAMVEIRNLSKSLLPPSLGELGLLQALSELAGNIKQLSELNITIDWHELDENELSGKLKLAIFRIVQEQLNNVIKHSGANTVNIGVKKSQDAIEVSVKDNGCGFDPSEKRSGVGLRNILSRAEVNNGVAIIDSRPGEGCELLVTFRVVSSLKRSA